LEAVARGEWQFEPALPQLLLPAAQVRRERLLFMNITETFARA
jgi:hypothetical protein